MKTEAVVSPAGPTPAARGPAADATIIALTVSGRCVSGLIALPPVGPAPELAAAICLQRLGDGQREQVLAPVALYPYAEPNARSAGLGQFKLTIPFSLMTRAEQRVIVGLGRPGQGVAIASCVVDPRPFQAPFGHLDGIAGGILRGWAWDPARPDQGLEALLLCRGRVVARRWAGFFRGDLLAAGIGDGCHAFELDLRDSKIAPGERLELSIDGATALASLVLPPQAAAEDRITFPPEVDDLGFRTTLIESHATVRPSLR